MNTNNINADKSSERKSFVKKNNIVYINVLKTCHNFFFFK